LLKLLLLLLLYVTVVVAVSYQQMLQQVWKGVVAMATDPR